MHVAKENTLMKAVGLHTYGGPRVLELVDVPEPHAGPGQVRIRVQAFAVNPADVMFRDGTLADWYAGATPPFIPGMDVAGVVDEVGADAPDAPAVGTPVVAVVDNGAEHGGYSQLLALPAASVVAAPAGIAPTSAASFLMNALTAHTALHALELPAGAVVLVTGGAGAVGGYAIQLAAMAGLKVVALGSPTDDQLLRSFGAGAVIVRGADAAARVRELVPGGVDGLIDGAALGAEIGPAVRDGGRVAAVRPLEEDLGRGITVTSVNVRDHINDTDTLIVLRDLVEAKKLALRVAHVAPAHQAAAAHELLERGGLRGRIVLEW